MRKKIECKKTKPWTIYLIYQDIKILNKITANADS